MEFVHLIVTENMTVTYANIDKLNGIELNTIYNHTIFIDGQANINMINISSSSSTYDLINCSIIQMLKFLMFLTTSFLLYKNFKS